MKVLILGVNGFIGNALTERILARRTGRSRGSTSAATRSRRSSGTRGSRTSRATSRSTRSGSSTRSRSATSSCRSSRSRRRRPTCKHPLAVFELDFEENLRIVKQAVRYGKRVVFPSTSEVYGMCPDAEFDEERSTLVYGPIHKQRWIYSCSKQLLDRVIWAYGVQRAEVHALPPVQLDRPAPGRHRLAEGRLEPRPDAVPPQHPLRRADQARGRGHAAALVHLHLRRHRLPHEDPREPRGRRRRRNLQHRQPRQRSFRAAARGGARRRGRRAPELRRAGAPDSDRRGLLGRVLRRGLPGHPDARPVDPAREGDPRLGAQGRDGRGDPEDRRVLSRQAPGEEPGRVVRRCPRTTAA